MRKQEIVSMCNHFSEGNKLGNENENPNKEGGEGLSGKVRFQSRPEGREESAR